MITLTELAASKIKQSLQARGKGIGIRVGTRTSGCSGLSYILEFVDTPQPDLVEYPCHGVNVFVSQKDLAYLSGMKMDWKRNGLNEGFDFVNPNESARCGCGESFTV